MSTLEEDEKEREKREENLSRVRVTLNSLPRISLGNSTPRPPLMRGGTCPLLPLKMQGSTPLIELTTYPTQKIVELGGFERRRKKKKIAEVSAESLATRRNSGLSKKPSRGRSCAAFGDRKSLEVKNDVAPQALEERSKASGIICRGEEENRREARLFGEETLPLLVLRTHPDDVYTSR